MSTKHTDTHHTASKASTEAMHENDGHTTKAHSGDHVPGDETAHSHSHAAHLGNTFDVHTTPQGNVAADTRQDLKEPPVTSQTRARSEHGRN